MTKYYLVRARQRCSNPVHQSRASSSEVNTGYRGDREDDSGGGQEGCLNDDFPAAGSGKGRIKSSTRSTKFSTALLGFYRIGRDALWREQCQYFFDVLVINLHLGNLKDMLPLQGMETCRMSKDLDWLSANRTSGYLPNFAR